MAIPAATERQVEEIRSDRQHGANWLARQALGVLGGAAGHSGAASVPELQTDLAEVAASLRASRPSMAPIRFWLDRYSAALAGELAAAGDLDEARRRARELADRLARGAEEAQQAAAQRAAELIPDGATVLTCSSSATVVETFRALRRFGRNVRAIAIASVAADGTSHGERMARQLGVLGVPAEVLPDAEADGAVRRASVVLIGADTVLADGAVINGAPSLAVARAAARAGLPVYVVAERAKVDAELDAEAAGVEEGFDVVPGNLVAQVVTDEG